MVRKRMRKMFLGLVEDVIWIAALLVLAILTFKTVMWVLHMVMSFVMTTLLLGIVGLAFAILVYTLLALVGDTEKDTNVKTEGK